MLNVKILVSIVVPTKNSGRTIETCMKSIKKQTYPSIEVIVVDCYSSDSTKEIVENFGAKIVESGVGMSEARNIGVEKATGDWILSLDSDMELTPTVIEECIEKVKEGYDAVILPEISVGVGFWAKCKALEKTCYIGDELIEALRFFKRDIYRKVEGYDPELEFGEDWDFNIRIRKAGYRIGRINALIKHHEGQLSLWKIIRKKYQYGKTLERYKRKHPREANQQLRYFRPAFSRNRRKLVKEPMYALGMLLMKTCEFGATIFGHLLVR